MGALDRRAHGVEVVLADKEDGELPQRREIEGFVEEPLCGGAVAEEAGGEPLPAAHLVGKRQPDGQRYAPRDDGIAAVKARRRVEDMHRAAPASAAPFALAVHLRHQGAGRYAARQRMAVLPVGRDHGVVRREGLHDADGVRLLADIEVEKAADLAGAVKLD